MKIFLQRIQWQITVSTLYHRYFDFSSLGFQHFLNCIFDFFPSWFHDFSFLPSNSKLFIIMVSTFHYRGFDFSSLWFDFLLLSYFISVSHAHIDQNTRWGKMFLTTKKLQMIFSMLYTKWENIETKNNCFNYLQKMHCEKCYKSLEDTWMCCPFCGTEIGIVFFMFEILYWFKIYYLQKWFIYTLRRISVSLASRTAYTFINIKMN
jgi:hypothetical protein